MMHKKATQTSLSRDHPAQPCSAPISRADHRNHLTAILCRMQKRWDNFLQKEVEGRAGFKVRVILDRTNLHPEHSSNQHAEAAGSPWGFDGTPSSR